MRRDIAGPCRVVGLVRSTADAAPLVVAALVLAALALRGGARRCRPPRRPRSYSITDVEIESQIQPDGTLVVREWRTFSFDGDFTFVYWELDESGSQGIEVIGASGPSRAPSR